MLLEVKAAKQPFRGVGVVYVSDDDGGDDVVVVGPAPPQILVQPEPAEQQIVPVAPAPALPLPLATRRGAQVKNLYRKLKNASRRVARRDASVATLKLEIQRLKQLQTLTLERTKAGKRFTRRGSFAIAIRRNLSSVSARDIGAVLCDDCSRWTFGGGGAIVLASPAWC